MDGRTITRNLVEHFFFFLELVIERLVFKERYCAKHLGWPVVRYLYTRTIVLKIIPLIGSHFEVSSSWM